jgi:hypothetical protein
MKKLLFVFALILIVTSCGKWKGEKDHDLTYYSPDYKEKEMTILDFSANNIDALWFEFSSKDKNKEYTNYTFIAKSNGEINKQTGTCQIDWENQITFYPSNGDSFLGEWIHEKEKYVITYDLDKRSEEITFVYKELNKSKKGKK